MKRMMIAVALVFSCVNGYSQGLPPAPKEDINLRLEMAGVQSEKAGRARLNGILLGVCGGSVAMLIAQDRQAEKAAVGLGLASGLGFVAFEIKGAVHQMRAGAHLRGQ